MKAVQALAERHGLSILKERDSENEGDEEVKRQLTRVLLEVYMSGG